MKKIILFTIGILFLFLQFSCRKDTPEDTECPEAYVLNTIDINSLSYAFGELGVNNSTPTDPIYFYPQNNLIAKPVANPSNAFEFIFLKKVHHKLQIQLKNCGNITSAQIRFLS